MTSGNLQATNTGLKVLDTDASHSMTIACGSNQTADRILTLTIGDAGRTLDISAANVTVSSFGATLVDDTSARAACETLGTWYILAMTSTTLSFGTNTTAVATGTIATSSAQNIVISAQLTNTGDTVTLESYLIEISYGA